MAIWNVYDSKIIEEVVGVVTLDGQEQPPKKAPTVSVADYVRVQAARMQRKQRLGLGATSEKSSPAKS